MIKLALSIQQPWAWLIANGHKNIENRTWSTNFRGEFYIHAGQKIDYRGYDRAKKMIESLNLTIDLPPIHTLQTGGIVGTSIISDCVTSYPNRWFEGPYGFVLRGSKTIPFRKMPGKLKFFEVDLPNQGEVENNDKIRVTPDEICMMCHFSSECGECCIKCTNKCNAQQACALGAPYQAERLKSWLHAVNHNSNLKHLKKFIIKEATLNGKNQKAVKKEKHCMTLLVKYTDKEMADLARKFASLDTERDAIAKRKQAAMADFKAQQEAQQEAVDRIKDKIVKGGAQGTVECESSLDEKSKIIETVRLDTGEIVEGVGHPVLNLKEGKKNVSKNDKEIENLIKWYEKAKMDDEIKSMNKILDDLAEKGIVAEDTKDGVKWVRPKEEREKDGKPEPSAAKEKKDQ